jgi:1-acyl-sn-glycerol-3-phosphate acyltransferase
MTKGPKAPPKKKTSAVAPPKKKRAPRAMPRRLAGMSMDDTTRVVDRFLTTPSPPPLPSDPPAPARATPPPLKTEPAPPPEDDKTPLSHRAAIVEESRHELEIDDDDDDDDLETTRVALPRGLRPDSIAAPPPAVIAQIRDLEAQLDRLIDEASRRDLSELDPEPDDEDLEITRDALPESEPIPLPDRPPVPSQPAALPIPPAPPSEATVFDTARELLSTDFYLRKWGRLAMRGRSEEVDDFGFDPIYEAKLRSVLEFLYSRYFRVATTGIDRVPSHGRCLLVTNHSGTVPLDGVMLKTAVKLEHPAGRDLRWLTEDFIYHMPYLGSIMNRLGGVRACQENAERLLAKEQLVAVFPEGVKGIGKLFSERYRLQRFGRGGFIKLALRTQTPIVPVAVVGAEETNPLLFRFEYLSKALGVPYVPVTPTFPLLGPLGLLPAPTKWTIEFGEPVDFSGHGVHGADDELLVGRLAERVRATIQGMLDRGVGNRKSVFFG